MKRVTLKKREMSYAMTEELNTLRTNIQFSGVDKKVIVMTSSFSGEGKSTITYQLAKSLAELGKRVLLIILAGFLINICSAICCPYFLLTYSAHGRRSGFRCT